MARKGLKVWIGVLLFPWAAWSAPQEFVEESERDYSLKSIGQLEVKNFKGDIQVQGWSLDKIRIKVKKRVSANTSEEAKQLLGRITYRFRSHDSRDEDIEISNQYSEHLSLGDRLKESQNPSVQMEFVVLAPSRLKLKAWTTKGNLTIKDWNAPLLARSNKGAIKIEGIKAQKATVSCNACSVSLKKIRGSIHCTGGDAEISLNEVTGKAIYAEIESGSLRVNQISGDQLYVAKAGSISGERLEGKVIVQTRQAHVDLQNISGSLSGKTEKGNITATIKKWSPSGQTLIETIEGSIRMTLPWRLSATLDVWSVYGKTHSDFALKGPADESSLGPLPANHLRGRVKDGGDLLKLFSERGDIELLKSTL